MSITANPSRNGVDTAKLFATLDAIKAQNEIADFRFRASNTWAGGTHSRSTISGFYGAMQEMTHTHETVLDADHPAILVGEDHGPTPVEYVLHALAACLTAGLANIAAARGVRLTEVRSTVTGDIDLNGILGLNPAVRNGYQQITVRFTAAAAQMPSRVIATHKARYAGMVRADAARTIGTAAAVPMVPGATGE